MQKEYKKLSKSTMGQMMTGILGYRALEKYGISDEYWWNKIINNVESINRNKAEAAIRNLCKSICPEGCPVITWGDSVRAIWDSAKAEGADYEYSFASWFGGQFSDLCDLAAIKDSREDFKVWLEVAKTCSYWIPFGNTIFMSERPVKILHTNQDFIRDKDNKVAILWKDGFNQIYPDDGDLKFSEV